MKLSPASIGMTPLPSPPVPPLTWGHLPDGFSSCVPTEALSHPHVAFQVSQPCPIKAWFSDLDGTLYRHRVETNARDTALLAHLASALTAAALPFAYVTGRYIRGAEGTIALRHLPLPTFLSTSTGTAIYARHADTWVEVEAYRKRLLSHWPLNDPTPLLERILTRAKIPQWRRHTCDRLRQVYFSAAHQSTFDVQREVTHLLAEEGLNTIQVVVSGPDPEGRFHYDFIPDNGSKVDAARFIAQELLGLDDLTCILYTGDSGNDRDLLLRAGFATLVHTNEEGLASQLAAVRPSIHLSPFPHIYGVLHGMLVHGALNLYGVSG